MKEKTIEMETLSLPFTIEEDIWRLRLPKSQTRVKDFRQMRILSQAAPEVFVPMEVTEEGDSFHFTFTVEQTKKGREDLHNLHRNEKLRLLCNVAQLKKYLTARVTFFLHPDNLVFDDNLLPFVIYRGARGLIPPFEMNDQGFLKQLQCLSIALFSKKYSFEQLYNGALRDAKETEFERQVGDMSDLGALIDYLQENYRREQQKVEKNMQMVSVKRFRLFKQLSIIMIVVSVLLAVPLVYVSFFNLPYQQHLQDAHEKYLASDDGEVISVLEDENADKLPKAAKYILADSYVNVEELSEEKKEYIKKNISLKSDDDYLLYWIYNGRGEFEKALDTAKFLDDPSLIMNGLLQKREAVKDDPDLNGSDRDKEVKEIDNELDDYREEYGLDEDEDEQNTDDSDQDNEDADDESDAKKDKDKKDDSKKDEEK